MVCNDTLCLTACVVKNMETTKDDGKLLRHLAFSKTFSDFPSHQNIPMWCRSFRQMQPTIMCNEYVGVKRGTAREG